MNDELLRNLDQWEFIDPLDLKPDDMSEFSIYNLKSLFYNLHNTKKMSNKYTTLCVFLVKIRIIFINYKNLFFFLISNERFGFLRFF